MAYHTKLLVPELIGGRLLLRSSLRCAAPVEAASAGSAPISVSLAALVIIAIVAGTGTGADLSFFRTLVISPALTSWHTPARLHTRTTPENTTTFIRSTA